MPIRTPLLVSIPAVLVAVIISKIHLLIIINRLLQITIWLRSISGESVPGIPLNSENCQQNVTNMETG